MTDDRTPLPPLSSDFWGSRLTPAEAKATVRRLRDEMTELAASLDHLDHDIARDINAARSDLFAAWSKLRAAERELEA